MFFQKKRSSGMSLPASSFRLTTENGPIPATVDASLLLKELKRVKELSKLPMDGEYGFLILDPEQPIQGCEFVQMACDHGKPELTIEARINFEDGPHQFCKSTEDFDWLSSVFLQFLEGAVPDVSSWEEWT